MRQWTAGDVMSTAVVTVRPETPYKEVVDVLAEHRVSAAPVVDGRRQVLGVVSEADLLRRVEFLGEEHQRRVFERPTRREARAKAHGANAGDLMSAPAVTVQAGTPVGTVAQLLETERVKRVPVVDGEGCLIGIVSRRDLVKMYLRADGEIQDEVRRDVIATTLGLDPDDVQGVVADGVVSLCGSVDRRSDAELAGRLCTAVPGVVSVSNEVRWRYDDIADSRYHRSHPFNATA